jgi:hypothetical protein
VKNRQMKSPSTVISRTSCIDGFNMKYNTALTKAISARGRAGVSDQRETQRHAMSLVHHTAIWASTTPIAGVEIVNSVMTSGRLTVIRESVEPRS